MKMSTLITCAALSFGLVLPLATGAHAMDAMMKKHNTKKDSMMKHDGMKKKDGMMKGDTMQKDQPAQ